MTDLRAVVLQIRAAAVEDICMSRCYQCGGYGHSPQPPAPRKTPTPVESTRTLLCKRCDAPLDDHEMFGECFPHQYLRESSVLLHRGHLIAV
jgi:hypothetical protein